MIFRHKVTGVELRIQRTFEGKIFCVTRKRHRGRWSYTPLVVDSFDDYEVI